MTATRCDCQSFMAADSTGRPQPVVVEVNARCGVHGEERDG
jgi:hypothetical protein